VEVGVGGLGVPLGVVVQAAHHGRERRDARVVVAASHLVLSLGELGVGGRRVGPKGNDEERGEQSEHERGSSHPWSPTT
jgi:hypothetical protein